MNTRTINSCDVATWVGCCFPSALQRKKLKKLAWAEVGVHGPDGYCLSFSVPLELLQLSLQSGNSWRAWTSLISSSWWFARDSLLLGLNRELCSSRLENFDVVVVMVLFKWWTGGEEDKSIVCHIACMSRLLLFIWSNSFCSNSDQPFVPLSAISAPCTETGPSKCSLQFEWFTKFFVWSSPWTVLLVSDSFISLFKLSWSELLCFCCTWQRSWRNHSY